MPRSLTNKRLKHLRVMATRLQKEFPSETPARCLDIIARLEGFENWHVAAAAVRDGAPLGGTVGRDEPRTLATKPAAAPSAQSVADIKIRTLSSFEMQAKVSSILAAARLEKNQSDGQLRAILYTRTLLPGGTELYFLFLGRKDEKEECLALAGTLSGEKHAVVVVSSVKLSKKRTDVLSRRGVLFWSAALENELTAKLEQVGDPNFIFDLMTNFGLIEQNGAQSRVAIAPKAAVLLSTQVDENIALVLGARLTCAATGYNLLSFENMPVARYSMETLGVPTTAHLIVTDGMAPLGAEPARVELRLSPQGRLPVFPADSIWEVTDAVLNRSARV